MDTIFCEATASTYAGYETSFSLREAKCLAALCGGVIVEATEGVVGGSWAGSGWQQTQAITFVNNKLRFPSCIANQSHRIVQLLWNPVTGHLGALCQHTDDKGRLLDGHGKLQRDADGQTVRARGAKLDFINGEWRQVGPIECDRVSAEWFKRTQDGA